MSWTTGAGRRARTLLPVIGVLGGFGGMVACDNNGDLFDVVIPVVNPTVRTFKDSTFDFTKLHTFAMPDTVIHFNVVTPDISRQFDAVAINQVRQDLLARGYTQVAAGPGVTPDFTVLIGASSTPAFNAFASFSWFGDWGFFPGWGWFAPGFDTSWGIVFPWFPVVGVTAFDRGTLIVTITPSSSVDPVNKTIRAVWSGVATAILDAAVTPAVVTGAIDEMFAQSPYLTATP